MPFVIMKKWKGEEKYTQLAINKVFTSKKEAKKTKNELEKEFKERCFKIVEIKHDK